MASTRAQGKAGNNHIAEWFGHRIYPVVADSHAALTDQRTQRCPLISTVTGSSHECVKPANSKGVCTVSAHSNGIRQDWLVCPFRALDPALLEEAVRRLFGHHADVGLDIIPVTVLEDAARRIAFVERVQAGEPAVVYFQNKLGGEITLSATSRSPEMSFDATMVEVLPGADGPTLGRYGIFEIQTMDFHGSYSHAVNNLRQALHLHRDDFAKAVADHPEWPADRMEGPNIANVFKRTFYQMMFKFQIGAHSSSAGCAFAIPKSVWDSWQRHLGAPELVPSDDGTYRLKLPGPLSSDQPAAWIYVFELAESDSGPNEVALWRVIGTDAASLSHYALTVAPNAALEEGSAVDNIAASIRSRLRRYLPELASTPDGPAQRA